MGCWAERAGLLLAAVGMAGCFTGQLFDAARRVEIPTAIREARLTGDGLVVRYDAVVTTDLGSPVGRTVRWAKVPLAQLRGRDTVSADDVRPVWLDDGDPRTASGTDLALCRGPDGVEPVCGVGRPGADVEHDAEGRLAALRVSDVDMAPLPAAALTRIQTASWVWPLVPVAVAGDAVLTPVLVALWPIFPIAGD